MTKKAFESFLKEQQLKSTMRSFPIKEYSYYEIPNSNFEVDPNGNLFFNMGENRIKLHNPIVTNINTNFPASMNSTSFHGQTINIPTPTPFNHIDVNLMADYCEIVGPALEPEKEYWETEIWSKVFN
jgi:hypothetical protein